MHMPIDRGIVDDLPGALVLRATVVVLDHRPTRIAVGQGLNMDMNRMGRRFMVALRSTVAERFELIVDEKAHVTEACFRRSFRLAHARRPARRAPQRRETGGERMNRAEKRRLNPSGQKELVAEALRLTHVVESADDRSYLVAADKLERAREFDMRAVVRRRLAQSESNVLRLILMVGDDEFEMATGLARRRRSLITDDRRKVLPGHFVARKMQGIVGVADETVKMFDGEQQQYEKAQHVRRIDSTRINNHESSSTNATDK